MDFKTIETIFMFLKHPRLLVIRNKNMKVVLNRSLDDYCVVVFSQALAESGLDDKLKADGYGSFSITSFY